LRQFHDVIMYFRVDCGPLHVGIRRVHAAVTDVLAHARAEHEQILRHQREVPIEIGTAIVLDQLTEAVD
jgi:hypothetical protein